MQGGKAERVGRLSYKAHLLASFPSKIHRLSLDLQASYNRFYSSKFHTAVWPESEAQIKIEEDTVRQRSSLNYRNSHSTLPSEFDGPEVFPPPPPTFCNHAFQLQIFIHTVHQALPLSSRLSLIILSWIRNMLPRDNSLEDESSKRCSIPAYLTLTLCLSGRDKRGSLKQTALGRSAETGRGL